ncbi:MAG TPA: transketolase [Patescibacteria group bacterium]|jgi:transketolase|nr:transketolase [Patescibacteria group bacterium]
MDYEELKQLKLRVKKHRRTILSMIVPVRASHIGSSLSIIDVIFYLYSKVLHVNPKNPNLANRDRFILSKGWGASALYSVLAEKGFFKKSLLKTYLHDGSKLNGTTTRNGTPGIEATTGSAGHGLPIGVGMALAGKLQKKSFRVFVVLGDGECAEGSVWEAALQAGQYKLDNLIVIVDYNKLQGFGRVKDILDFEPFAKKWEAFKWSVKEINGHDFNEIAKVFSRLPFEENKPSVIIANTIKGKGVSIFEDKGEWHYKTPNLEEVAIALRELSE